MKNPLVFIKRRKGTVALIIGALLIIAYFALRSNSGTALPPTVTVGRGTITQEVTVTGKVKPATEIQLAFEKSGKIAAVRANIGDAVAAGQALVELDRTELLAQYAQAKANVDTQQAKLDELKRGARPEDIQVKQTELKKAQQDLTNEYQSVFDVLNDAYVKADDAVRKQIDALFTNDETTNPQLTFTVTDTQKKLDAESGREQSSAELLALQGELNDLLAHPGDTALANQDIQRAKQHLLVIRNFFDTLMDAVVSNANLDATTATTYKTNITTARTNVAIALTGISTQEQMIASQAVTVTRIGDELALLLAGSTTESIAAQQAQVEQAQASLDAAAVQLTKCVIRSPIAGVVTKQDAKLGEIAQPNIPLVSVISAGNLEVEANIPETDAAKLHLADHATMTFDAYGDEEFAGTVTAVDPAATVIEGVPTYRTTLALDTPDPRIRPGFTANLTIVTDHHENTLLIPQRSIIYRDGKKYVQVVAPNATQPEEREVTTGLRGSDGNIEVLSGVTEGERIVRTPE